MSPIVRPLLAAQAAFFIVAGVPSSPSAGLPAPTLPWNVLRPAPAFVAPDLPPAGPQGDTLTLSPEEARRIGRLIWRNESGGTRGGLTSWNAGEDFASLGIAHFIWYPEDQR